AVRDNTTANANSQPTPLNQLISVTLLEQDGSNEQKEADSTLMILGATDDFPLFGKSELIKGTEGVPLGSVLPTDPPAPVIVARFHDTDIFNGPPDPGQFAVNSINWSDPNLAHTAADLANFSAWIANDPNSLDPNDFVVYAIKATPYD